MRSSTKKWIFVVFGAIGVIFAASILIWAYGPNIKCRANDLCSATFYEGTRGAQWMSEVAGASGEAGVRAEFEKYGGDCGDVAQNSKNWLLCEIAKPRPFCLDEGMYSFLKDGSGLQLKSFKMNMTCV